MTTPDQTGAPGLVPGGPAVVAVGGGHGLSSSLRGIRRYAGSVTAVVSVADDGGSSGRLRAVMPDLPAPGDVRKCLGALAEEGSPFGRILEHRFDDGELEGHALGNLLLVALALEMGSFTDAVEELGERVGAVGRVLPATVGPVALEGDRSDDAGGGEPVVGQVAVQNTVGLRRLRLLPESPASSPEVADAILGADQVVIGPGSLFTSVLAASIVPAVRDSLRRTTAQRVYVANLAAQVPETQGLTVADELALLEAHGVVVDVVVVDPVRALFDQQGGVPCVERRVAHDHGASHDPVRLAVALEDLLDGRARSTT